MKGIELWAANAVLGLLYSLIAIMFVTGVAALVIGCAMLWVAMFQECA